MSQTLLALYGLKWNPFSADLPIAAVSVSPKVEDFCWRIEHVLVREGGFALIQGDPGTGKSVILRLLAERLSRLPDLTVGAIHHPQSNFADFSGNWEISLPSPSNPVTAGAASRPCASAGSPIWRPPAAARCCSSTKPRR